MSPQFHIVFDDLIETVICNGDNDAVVNSICDGLFNWNRKLYVEDEFDADDMLIYRPPHCMKSGSMRLDAVKGRRTYFGNAVEMKT